jgi:phenylalanyl-tRNA synthetase beta subunit
VRDIAVWVHTDQEKQLLQKLVENFAEKHCVTPAVLFDTFTKDDPSNPSGQATSVAYRLVFQSFEKTFTTEEVDALFDILLKEITQHTGMSIR